MPLTPQQVNDEVAFWLGRQDSDHNRFFALGIEDPALRQQAQQLTQAYDAAAQRGDLNALLQLAGPSQRFKDVLLAAMRERWIGWIFPEFVTHTKTEIDQFLRRIGATPPSARDELCFYTLIAAQHAAFAAHLLDPSEVQAIDAASRQAAQLGGLHNACMQQTMPSLVALSDRYGHELDQYFQGAKATKPKSVIHPALLDHVIREGQRFLGTVHAVQAMGPAAGP